MCEIGNGSNVGELIYWAVGPRKQPALNIDSAPGNFKEHPHAPL
jgi:hypothetical protein